MAQNEPKHAILTDQPATADALDFQPYIDSLTELIVDETTSTPLTIGVFGQWGSGKTTLMRLVRAQVARESTRYRTVWFNAWKYDREELALWRTLILRTLDALRPRKRDGTPYSLDELPSERQQKLVKELDRLEQSVYQTVEWTELGQWTVDWVKALEGTVEGAAEIALSFVPGAQPLVGLLRQARNAIKGKDGAEGKEVAPITEAFQREASEFRREQLSSVEQFIDNFEKLVKTQVVGRGKRGRLIVFIDDLDRCLPERTIEVLEAIKLFLDVPGCFFVLGVDPAKIQEGIELRYKVVRQSDEGANYLEKIIQLPFTLPTIERYDMQAFVEALNVAFPDVKCAAIFAQGLDPNPRQIKRAINSFLLLWKLAGKRRLKGEAADGKAQRLREVLTPLRLAKVVALQHSFSELYEVLKLTPRYLGVLEGYYRQPEPEQADEAGDQPPGPSARSGQAQGSKRELPEQLGSFVSPRLQRLLTLFLDDETACFTAFDEQMGRYAPLDPTQLRRYFTLAGRTETERRPGQAHSPPAFEPETVLIPAGSFSMGSDPEKDKAARDNETPQHTVELLEYRIGRYPVTNLEYQAFVEASGQTPPEHWESGQMPEGLSDHPVVNVSWEDAVAYCRWLSEQSGRTYRLPSEAEWEKAARGDDGRIYPWGNEWDASRANTGEAGPGNTTPVGQYSTVGGDSPYGLADMAGNVWEWTADWYQAYPESDYQSDEYGEQYRVVRGGSFTSSRTTRAARSASGSTRTTGSTSTGFGWSSPPSLCPLALGNLYSEGRIFENRVGFVGKGRGTGEGIPLPREASIEMETVYEQVCDWENLRQAYKKGARGKRGKQAAAQFEYHLADNLLTLQESLLAQTYQPGEYVSFYIHDPKRRLISAAPFRDRVVHHALCNVIEPPFERSFIADSYANRVGKGTHRALDRAQHFARRYRYILQCDVEQFFPAIDHEILGGILARKITDPQVLWLIDRILASGVGILSEEYQMHYFSGDDLLAVFRPRGLPIGNLTSQFWANCYLNPFDHFVKRQLRCPAYLRYVDDFALFGDDKATLWRWKGTIEERLAHFRLTIHPGAHPRPTREGFPFLGFVVYPTHRRVKRRKVVAYRRRFKGLLADWLAEKESEEGVMTSLMGWINHVRYGDTWGLRRSMVAHLAAAQNERANERRQHGHLHQNL